MREELRYVGPNTSEFTNGEVCSVILEMRGDSFYLCTEAKTPLEYSSLQQLHQVWKPLAIRSTETDPLPDPRAVFGTADHFSYSTDHLNTAVYETFERQKALNNPNVEFQPYAIPTAVYGAFSLELYLKCLLLLEGKTPPKSHNLKSLFNRLETATKTQLERYIEVPIRPGYALSFRLSDTESSITNNAPAVSINVLLEEGQEIFQQFRYVYDFISTRLGVIHYNLDRLRWAIRRLILERKPEWVSTSGPDRTPYLSVPTK